MTDRPPAPFPAAILALALAAPPLAAQQPEPSAEMAAMVRSMVDEATPAGAAHEFQALRVDAREFRSDWKAMVRGQGWHSSLQTAADRAANEGKLVLWVQALGAMTGFT